MEPVAARLCRRPGTERGADDLFEVVFAEQQYGVACGQACVLYSGERVLGGGIITQTLGAFQSRAQSQPRSQSQSQPAGAPSEPNARAVLFAKSRLRSFGYLQRGGGFRLGLRLGSRLGLRLGSRLRLGARLERAERLRDDAPSQHALPAVEDTSLPASNPVLLFGKDDLEEIIRPSLRSRSPAKPRCHGFHQRAKLHAHFFLFRFLFRLESPPRLRHRQAKFRPAS